MKSDGLHEVINPNELFLNERSRIAAPGSAIIVTNEGTRPLMVEIQALVGSTSYASPRRVTNGIDLSRLWELNGQSRMKAFLQIPLTVNL